MNGNRPAPADPVRIGRVAELADRYDVVLCDVWGVIHDGRRMFPAAARALRSLREAGVYVVLLTNVPRPSSTLPVALERLSFPVDAWDAAVTSGDASRVELARRAPGPVHRIGRATDTALWEGLGLKFSDLSRAQFLAISGLTDSAQAPQAYYEVLRVARERDLDLVCANPDVQVMVGQRLVWCAGAVAAVYEELGGRVVQAGKPHPAIYSRAGEVVAGLAGGVIPDRRVLAIGDGLTTDILGANRQGLDSLFIATGIHGTSLLREGRVDLGRVSEALAGAGVTATYVMERLS